jgi:hypothetical protein
MTIGYTYINIFVKQSELTVFLIVLIHAYDLGAKPDGTFCRFDTLK